MHDDTNVITAEGLQSLQRQLEELEGEGRREIATRIRTAREWGDLKENSEYHDAKNEQAHLETKILRLRERISRSVIVEADSAGAGVVGFGSTVVVRDEAGREQTWQLVSSHEASPPEGRLSFDSPVAQALVGRRAGEQAAIALPRGERTLTVVSVV
jgi:transcription elongation factor GreA